MPDREAISDVRSGNKVYDNRVPEKTGERVKPYSVPRSPCFEDIHNPGRVEEESEEIIDVQVADMAWRLHGVDVPVSLQHWTSQDSDEQH